MSKWLEYAKEEYASGHYGRASFYARMSVAEDQKRAADAQDRIAEALENIMVKIGAGSPTDEPSLDDMLDAIEIETAREAAKNG